jgi:CMP-N,N'-diacetyllegionaminic acid synthase
MEVTVVIPCRAGSTRVKNKNFRPFGDSSLLEIKVNQAKTLGLPVVIDSDSTIAKEVAEENGIQFRQRPEYYASSICNNSEYYEYLGKSVDTEYIMILQPTAPLLKDETLKKSYETFKQNVDKYDSLVTAQFAKKHAWYKNSPINYDIANTPNSQDLDPIVLPTFNVMIARVSSLLETRNAITGRCLFYEVSEDESIEIDNQLEFDIAEFMYKKFKYENK